MPLDSLRSLGTGVLLLLTLAAAAHAEPARATLQVRPRDRVISIRPPAATATLSVRTPKAVATLDVAQDGYARIDAHDLEEGGTILSGGVPFLDFVPGNDPAPTLPAFVECGDVALELPVPAADAADPRGIDLVIETPEASIRQTFEGPDVCTIAEDGSARAVFLGHVADDQRGPATLTLSCSSRQTWTASVYQWTWVAETSTVALGQEASFRLDVAGLPRGAEIDVTLDAPAALALARAPAGFRSVAPNTWRGPATQGTFVFETPTEGQWTVVAEMEPCAR